ELDSEHTRHVGTAYRHLERACRHRQRDVQHRQDQPAMGHSVGVAMLRPHRQGEAGMADLRLVHAKTEPVQKWNLEGKALRGCSHGPIQKTSNRPAAPMPPPTHMVTTA